MAMDASQEYGQPHPDSGGRRDLPQQLNAACKIEVRPDPVGRKRDGVLLHGLREAGAIGEGKPFLPCSPPQDSRPAGATGIEIDNLQPQGIEPRKGLDGIEALVDQLGTRLRVIDRGNAGSGAQDLVSRFTTVSTTT